MTTVVTCSIGVFTVNAETAKAAQTNRNCSPRASRRSLVASLAAFAILAAVGPLRSSRLSDFDGDVGRVGDDVVDRGALLRLRDERLDVGLGRVGVDVEGDLDVVVPVAHVAVDAEDALDVHRSFELRFD